MSYSNPEFWSACVGIGRQAVLPDEASHRPVKLYSSCLMIAGLWFSIPALALNVCADPNYLPFSNRAGAGFENKIATFVAAALGETVTYTWASFRGRDRKSVV